MFFFSSRRRHTSWPRDWSSTCALPISGVYQYQPGEMRRYVRSTAAHNTVAVAGAEQSEVWGEFRVGRRAQLLSAGMARQAQEIGRASCRERERRAGRAEEL